MEIDVELAPVILALWALGVATRQCCQYDEFSDSAEISFPTTSDMNAFVELIFPGGYDETDELQARIRDWDVYDPASNTRRMGWRWAVAPEWTGTKWDFVGRVEFPTSDLPTIVERLQRTTRCQCVDAHPQAMNDAPDTTQHGELPVAREE